MFHNEAAIRQLGRVSLGEVVCVGLMLGVYALIGKFTPAVLAGAVFGCVVTILYFASISITISKAADKAEKTGEAAKARQSVQVTSTLRLAAVGLVYIIILKAGLCDPLAALLPLIFLRVSVNVTEFFRKSGDSET